MSKPSTLLYYDTISSFPAIIYKRFINKNVRLFVHYHEFMSKMEYQNGMKMIRWFHALEKKELSGAIWISNTNQDRNELFANDLRPVQVVNMMELPNYPPDHWKTVERETRTDILKIVQVGAVGLDTMYVREFSNWVQEQNGNVIWDIYTFKLDKETEEFFQKLGSPWVSVKKPVDYKDLPEVLSKYDVGIILYKGHIPNYVYNAPNKLFEYHVCGLDVWFPSHMISALRFQTSGTFPRIVSVDFENMKSDLKELTDHTSLVYRKISFSADDIYEPFLEKLCS